MVKYFHYHIPDLDIWYDHPVESVRCEEIKPNGQRCRKKCVIGSPNFSIHLKYKHFLVILDSEIPGAGKGLYVWDPHKGEDDVVFKKGDRICYYNGEVLTEEQFNERYPARNYTAPYTVELHNHQYEDGALQRGVGALINHKPSRHCNCKLSIGRNNRAQIIATKTIRNYEELFCNYGRGYKFNENGLETSTNNRKYNA
jgi:hypothetical protein